MNFLVLSSGGKCTARLDSTRCKDNGDYFVPDDVIALGYVPIAYARMCRTGKALGKQFISRYYDVVGFGVLLYPATCLKNGEPHYCRATGACFDRTSLMPLAMYDAEELWGNSSKVFSVFRNGVGTFDCKAADTRDRIEDALEKCSAHTTVHKGDLVLAELDSIRTLCTRNDDETDIRMVFCGEDTLEICVKF